ncbi:UDP-glucose 4-epimerase GalE [Zoogloea sp.]|uniref:UDP-glucose 4-epimerase GalE n=2 Tax=Zoogloea sp. TaxID=49181 RepID=UPI002B597EB1|nr:UDP-glucose 4-epimerase GalE [Zoogloea sp.]MBK7848603.1 UDP-glucose 4-epimerase GalE [Zoogloea sp.]HPI59327.1 UDP-glucose 4-epimerase GalE [Zoogloea sp.]HRH73688.1 UDP-glucose 4-epimerase GalE [Zoogloea sp.]
MPTILVTGGAGYIGSHTCVELLGAGYDVVVIDNFCNSKPEALRRVEDIAGRKLLAFYSADVRDKRALRDLFKAHAIDAVIHFAALKAVGESVAKPLMYYDNNIAGTVALTEVMGEAGVKSLVFSSSATVYGDPASVPIREDFPTGPTNPYGRTKWMMEFVLSDLAAADPEWRVALLRYFNPVGAHASGRIGEDPNGLPNNLMPFVSQVAVGRLPQLRVFGGDYPTPDGTGVRDYIHVVDLAVGHVAAVRRLTERPGVLTVNLGTGRGYSVIEVVKAFEKASGRPVPYEIVARRPGDVAQCYAEPSLAEEELGWRASRGIDEMCADSWRWQSSNPQGYTD